MLPIPRPLTSALADGGNRRPGPEDPGEEPVELVLERVAPRPSEQRPGHDTDEKGRVGGDGGQGSHHKHFERDAQ